MSSDDSHTIVPTETSVGRPGSSDAFGLSTAAAVATRSLCRAAGLYTPRPPVIYQSVLTTRGGAPPPAQPPPGVTLGFTASWKTPAVGGSALVSPRPR